MQRRRIVRNQAEPSPRQRNVNQDFDGGWADAPEYDIRWFTTTNVWMVSSGIPLLEWTGIKRHSSLSAASVVWIVESCIHSLSVVIPLWEGNSPPKKRAYERRETPSDTPLLDLLLLMGGEEYSHPGQHVAELVPTQNPGAVLVHLSEAPAKAFDLTERYSPKR